METIEIGRSHRILIRLKSSGLLGGCVLCGGIPKKPENYRKLDKTVEFRDEETGTKAVEIGCSNEFNRNFFKKRFFVT